MLAAVAEGYVLLRGIPAKQLKLWTRTGEKKPEAHYFTMDLKTFASWEAVCVGIWQSRQFSLRKLPTTVFAAKCMKS